MAKVSCPNCGSRRRYTGHSFTCDCGHYMFMPFDAPIPLTRPFRDLLRRPGWHQDPQSIALSPIQDRYQRYWDGDFWTAQTRLLEGWYHASDRTGWDRRWDGDEWTDEYRPRSFGYSPSAPTGNGTCRHEHRGSGASHEIGGWKCRDCGRTQHGQTIPAYGTPGNGG